MADPAITTACACVECGSNFLSTPRPGRPRLRCEDCVPYRPAPSKAQPGLTRIGRCVECGESFGHKAQRGQVPVRCPACKAAGRRTVIVCEKRAGPRVKDKQCQCVVCGVDFWSAKSTTKHCGSECQLQATLLRRRQGRPAKGARRGRCERCGETYNAHVPAQRFCGETCRDRANDKARRQGRARRAYLQAWREAHRPDPKPRPEPKWPSTAVWFATCLCCGSPFAGHGRRVKFCPSHATANQRKAYEIAARNPARGVCAECGTTFIRPRKGKLSEAFCSPTCSTRHTKRVWRQARRAKEAAATVEQVNPFTVFRRDGWRCQMCGIDTPRRLRGSYDPAAPELDHIIPLSRGGEHSYRNTQCACRRCNGAKGDSVNFRPAA